MKPAKIHLLAALFSFAANGSFAQITIGSTPGAPDLWAPVYNTSGDRTQTFAQVITPPGGVDLALRDFSFTIMRGIYGDISFTAAVAEWSGTQIGGTVWTQTGFSTDGMAGGVPALFTFSPNVTLDGAKTYALLVLADVSSDSSFADIALMDNDPGNTQSGDFYRFYTSPNVADLSGLAGPGWTSYAGIHDLAFSANFGPVSAVPEPSIPGLALGLSGLAGYAAWRRKRTATLSCAHQASSPPTTGPSVPRP